MKRTLLLGSAWTASAAAAVGLGFLAVSLVDASASTAVPTLGVTASATGAPDSPTPSGQQVTEGGTVYASCTAGVPVLASAPAAGWWLDDSQDVGKAEFENGTSEIEVRATCVDGVVQFVVEGPQPDDSGGGRATTPAPGSAPAASTVSSPADDSTHPGGDDSDGRSGGGHGSDD